MAVQKNIQLKNKSGDFLYPRTKLALLVGSDGVTQVEVALKTDLASYYLKTETYNKTEVDNLIAGIKQFSYEVVTTDPTTWDQTEMAKHLYKIILYKPDATKSTYYEYIVINTGTESSPVYKVEKFGDTDIKLEDYYKKSEIDAKVTTLETAIGGKVDKETGKGLSTNDFTDELESKLDGIAAGAQVNVIEKVKLNGSDLSVDADKRVDLGSLASSSELSTLAGRVTTAEEDIEDLQADSHTHSNKSILDGITADNLLDAGQKDKLDGIAAGAQVNVLEGVKVNNVELTITDKKVNIDLSGKVDKTQTIAGVDLQDNITKAELLTALNVTDGANKVEASSTNGNIKINGTETTVYTEVANTVHDADYQHITVVAGNDGGVTAGSGDGAITYKYDDTELVERVENLEARGRFLSSWNVATGLPSTYPTIPESAESPYTYSYKSGDYYIVGSVSSTGTKYMPNGSSITATKSGSTWTWEVGKATTTAEIGVGDYYTYDGSKWVLVSNSQKTVEFKNIAGDPDDNTNLKNALDAKQDQIKVGAELSADLVIDGTTNHVFTADDDTKLAGISTGANKVTVTTEKSGKIEIDGAEKQVTPDNLVVDANYKHITISSTDGVTDGTNTYKYDDSTLSGRIDDLEDTVGDSTSGLVKDVNTLKSTVGDSTSGLVKDVNTIKSDYLKAADKTELQGDITDVSDRVTDLEALASVVYEEIA